MFASCFSEDVKNAPSVISTLIKGRQGEWTLVSGSQHLGEINVIKSGVSVNKGEYDQVWSLK